MEELTKAQKGRSAIRAFKTMAGALALRGFYRPNGKSGQTLEEALRTLSPEIYGSMNDPRRIEIKGLEYVLDRLPRGIESCNRIVLTAQEDFHDTPFEPIQPLKRRRISYRVSRLEICFVITRGLSEIYDILTHITFLNIEAKKIYQRMTDDRGETTVEWKELESYLKNGAAPEGAVLDQALWNLSILLGRTYQETRATYASLEKSRKSFNSNSGLFQIVHGLGRRMALETEDKDEAMMVYFTPPLQEMIGHHRYAENWARQIKDRLAENGLLQRSLHIISANMHSVVNILYGWAALQGQSRTETDKDLYRFVRGIRGKGQAVRSFAADHGLMEVPDVSGAKIDCQIIDTAGVAGLACHPAAGLETEKIRENQPVLLVMDYAFGTQAFEVMDELLDQLCTGTDLQPLNIGSISIMGKAGILPGKKGDIILATAHVVEGTTDNYMVENDLHREDFGDDVDVYTGPMVTVLGTSLQNRDVLERFQATTWRAVGLEMEGGHYQRAISAAMIRGHIPKDVKLRYAYYASDNPLVSGQTLASGGMGEEGIKPAYLITRVILKKIFS
ncbi:MAG: hypothetical protein K9L59_14295 [Desulfobacterales bacterium]|nr:hypothetical protein [Desulfobacterales bacterium]